MNSEFPTYPTQDADATTEADAGTRQDAPTTATPVAPGLPDGEPETPRYRSGPAPVTLLCGALALVLSLLAAARLLGDPDLDAAVVVPVALLGLGVLLVAVAALSLLRRDRSAEPAPKD